MSTPYRIVIFYKRLTAAGGAERQVVEECKFMRSQGIDARLLTYDVSREATFGYPLDEIERIEGRNGFERLMALRRRLLHLRPVAVSVTHGLLDVHAATRLTGVPYIYYHNSPVLLYSEGPLPGPYALIHKRVLPLLRQRGFIAGLVPERWPYGIRSRPAAELRAWWEYRAVRDAGLVVALSRSTCAEIALMYHRRAAASRGCLDRRLFSYQPRVDVRAKHDLHGKRIILSICRLTVEKRVDVLLEAFSRVRVVYPDTVLLVGGAGPEKLTLERLAQELGIAASVQFLGFIPESMLWDYYAGCDVFATPAWADFNIAPYEALALGAKVVWSSEMEAWPGEIESGRIFPANPTAAAFAYAIVRALESAPGHQPDLSHYQWPNKFTPALEYCNQLALRQP